MQKILHVFDNRVAALEFFKELSERYFDKPANLTTLTVWTGDNTLEQITSIEEHQDAYRFAGMVLSGVIYHGEIPIETRQYIAALVRNLASD